MEFLRRANSFLIKSKGRGRESLFPPRREKKRNPRNDAVSKDSHGRILLVHWPITRYHNRHSLTSADRETLLLLLPDDWFPRRVKKDEAKVKGHERRTENVVAWHALIFPLMANRLLGLGATQKRQQQ